MNLTEPEERRELTRTARVTLLPVKAITTPSVSLISRQMKTGVLSPAGTSTIQVIDST